MLYAFSLFSMDNFLTTALGDNWNWFLSSQHFRPSLVAMNKFVLGY